MKIIMLILCITFFICGRSLAEEIEIDSEVFIVKPEQGYFIIKAGQEDGVKAGDGLIVYKEGKKIADAYVIEAQPTVSACKALNLEPGKEIKVGDNILLVKKEIEVTPSVTSLPPPTYTPTLPQGIERTTDITIEIESLPKVVFFYIKQVLRENSYSIISSNRQAGLIHAQKSVELSLLKELWADAWASIDHKAVIIIEMKEVDNYLRISSSFFLEYFKKDSQIKKALPRSSKYYKELLDILSKIKERSEH